MEHTEPILNEVAVAQQNLQPEGAVANQSLQSVPTPGKSSSARDVAASDTSLPIVHPDK